MKSFINFLLEDSPDTPYKVPGSFTGLDVKPSKEGDKPDGTMASPGPYDVVPNFNTPANQLKPKEGDQPLKEITNKRLRIWLKQLKRPHLKGKYFAFRKENNLNMEPFDEVGSDSSLTNDKKWRSQ